MSTLSLSTMIARNEEVAYTYMDDEMVMMGLDDNRYYGVNAVGADIWNALERGALSVKDVCEYLFQRYAVDESQCMADALAFIDHMHEKRMISVL